MTTQKKSGESSSPQKGNSWGGEERGKSKQSVQDKDRKYNLWAIMLN